MASGCCRRPGTPLTARRPRIQSRARADGLRQRGVKFSRCLAAGARRTSTPYKKKSHEIREKSLLKSLRIFRLPPSRRPIFSRVIFSWDFFSVARP
jgi:hypothetical protein